MDDFDRLLKDALIGDDEMNGLSVDEELIASTMKAIEEAAPRREEIRASYDEAFGKEEAGALHEEVPAAETNETKKKGFFTKNNIIAIGGALAGVAAVVCAVIFLGSSGSKSEMSSSSTKMAFDSAATTESATWQADSAYEYEAAAEAPAADMSAAATEEAPAFAGKAEAKMKSEETVYSSGGTSQNMADSGAEAKASGIGGTTPADDGYYYFEDDDFNNVAEEEVPAMLNDVYMLYDKNLYKPILDAVRNAATGEPEVFDARNVTFEEPAAAEADAASGEMTAEAPADDFDINDPAQLAQALKDSQKMLEASGGLPSENAGEVIGSIEKNGETVPDFEFAPEKSPFWVEIGDSSDESFEEVAPLIVIYDRDVDADLDVCVSVYADRCIIYDFALDTTTTYTVEDGETLAGELARIAGQ